MADHVHSNKYDSTRRLMAALVITGIYMLVEIAGGLLSGSLALLADAGHMATDNAALLLALWASHRAKAPASAEHTYGYRRYKILAALINGLTLLLLSGWIIIEAIQRLLAPSEVLGELMLVIALGGLLVNLVAFKILHAGSSDMNVRAATAHVMGDLMGSVAAILAAGIIMFTGWYTADPLLSIVVALIILKTGWGFVQETWHILVEGIPPGFDEKALKNEMPKAVPGIINIHHVHAWSLTTDKPYFLTLHVTVEEDASNDGVLQAVRSFVQKRFDIDHVTIQIEQGSCPDNENHNH